MKFTKDEPTLDDWEKERLRERMKEPKRIFLQVGKSYDSKADDFDAKVKWCADKTNDNDLCYVRAGKKSKAMTPEEALPIMIEMLQEKCEHCIYKKTHLAKAINDN